MGGFGSGGPRGKPAADSTSAALRLDVRPLIAAAIGGAPELAGVAVSLAERTLTIRGPLTIVVELEPDRPHFGGLRWWALCPWCSRRVAVLFRDRLAWACRTCHRLAYPTAQCSHQNRTLHRARRIHARLRSDASFGIFSGAARPRGMHRRTYDRLLAELEELRLLDLAAAARRWG